MVQAPIPASALPSVWQEKLTTVVLLAGMGLPGLLCAKLGAHSVLSSDYVPEVCGSLEAHLQPLNYCLWPKP